MLKLANRSGTDHCDACADTGWCLLVTTTMVRSVTYADGCAPCRWCEAGALRYARQSQRYSEHKSRLAPYSDFDGDAVMPQVCDAHYVPVSRAEAARHLQRLRAIGFTSRSESPSKAGRLGRIGKDTAGRPASPHAPAQTPMAAS